MDFGIWASLGSFRIMFGTFGAIFLILMLFWLFWAILSSRNNFGDIDVILAFFQPILALLGLSWDPFGHPSILSKSDSNIRHCAGLTMNQGRKKAKRIGEPSAARGIPLNSFTVSRSFWYPL